MLGVGHWSLIVHAALRWSAPAECPQEDVVRARLAATADTPLAGGANADVTVTRDAQGRYVATIAVREARGDIGLRTLQESTCDVLADAVVTVLGLSLESPAAPPPPVVKPAPAPARIPEAPLPNAASREPAAPADLHFAAGLLVSMDQGTLPAIAVGGGLEVAWYPLPRLRIEASVLRWIGQSSSVTASSGGTFDLTSGTLRACWSPLGETFTFGPCVGLDVDHVDAAGYGASDLVDTDATWWAPSIGALVRWQPLRRLAITGLADVAFPLTRPTFGIEGAGAIYTPNVAAPRGQIAAEVRF